MQAQTDQDKTEQNKYIVHILDLSSDQKDKTAEIVTGFYNLEHANAFVKSYVRDSVERCRIPGATRQEIFDAWSAFGEDAKVINAEEGEAWNSADAIMMFIETAATSMERDWRSLDPRRLVEDDEFLEDEE